MIAENKNTLLTCPIRGFLSLTTKGQNDDFLEEYYRIELIRYLLKKGYQKESFYIEYKVDVGNNPRNKYLRVDILIKKNKKNYIVCEIKRDNKNKNDAIENQLIPAIKLLDAKIGIYYDGKENVVLFENKEYSLSKLPNLENDFNSKDITINDLQRIKNINFLYDYIDQLSFNHGISKDERYKGLFQIIITKYYDEKYNFKRLKFIYSDNNLYRQINDLYNEAKNYYQNISVQIEFLKKDLILPENVIKNIVKYLEQYTFLNSDLEIIQSFFMKFGTIILKKDLQQYYTPYTIIKFIASILDIKNTNLVIDPAGGTGDFLIGILDKYKKYSDAYKNNLFYYDVSKDASYLAFVNMILHGDGKTNIKVKDSIENYKQENNKFDFVITNPPFGNKTIWAGDLQIMNHYDLGKKIKKTLRQQLGILFIERAIKFLKKNGVMVIILPSGYLNNKSQKFIREYLLNNTQIIACISLPDGSFKGAGTGVKTEILIVKKNKNEKNYNIFFDEVKNIGFDYKKNRLPPVYIRNDSNGEFIIDKNNNKILNNDFIKIKKSFLKFIYDHDIAGFEKYNYRDIEYNSENIDTIKKDNWLTIKPELYSNKYKNHINDIKRNTTTLSTESIDCIISNNDHIKEEIILHRDYFYIDIKNSSRGDYFLDNKLKGWEIKEIERAKQTIKKNDICLSYLNGSKNKFFIMLNEDTDNIIVSNGFYKINIQNKLYRLSFYKFLFTDSYSIQFDALTTGHIQTNITLEKIKLFRFPLLTKEKLDRFEKIINSLKEYKTLQNH